MANTETALEAVVTILEGMDKRLDGIDNRLRALEAGEADPTAEAVARLAKIGNAVAAPAAPPTVPPKPPKAPPVEGLAFPPEWPQMDEAQQYAWIRAHTGLIQTTETPEVATINIGGEAGAEFPAAPEEIKQLWRDSAEAIFENWVVDVKKGITIGKEQAADAYAQAGPLWLAAYAHDFLMGLPVNWRQQMVEQVLHYAPVNAKYLGRDILRVPTDGAKTWAYDDALDAADERLKGIVRGEGASRNPSA